MARQKQYVIVWRKDDAAEAVQYKSRDEAIADIDAKRIAGTATVQREPIAVIRGVLVSFARRTVIEERPARRAEKKQQPATTRQHKSKPDQAPEAKS